MLNETNQLEQLLPNNCLWFVSDQVPDSFALYNDELRLTNKMAKKRLNDFKASRYCAREVLNQLNIDNFPILIDNNRAPIWPYQVIGSLSHTAGRCIAVATRSKLIRSIGIDVESASPLKSELIEQIVTKSEIMQIAKIGSLNSYAKVIFSIKESVYKCLHPVFKKWIGFKDVSVLLDVNNNRFSITPECSLEPTVNVTQLNGSWIKLEDWIYTCCWLKNET